MGKSTQKMFTDFELERKIQKGPKEEVDEAITFIFNNWGEDIISLIQYKLRETNFRDLSDRIFTCGLELFKYRVKNGFWENRGPLKGYLRKICHFKTCDLLNIANENNDNVYNFFEKCSELNPRITPRYKVKVLPTLIRKIGFRCTAILWLYWGESRLYWSENNNNDLRDISKRLRISYGYARNKSSECHRNFYSALNDDDDFRKFMDSNRL